MTVPRTLQVLSRPASLFALALVVRVGFSLFVYPHVVTRAPSWAWEVNDNYDAIARSLVDEGVYAIDGATPTARRLPAYPLLLAAAYRASSDHFILLVQLLQAVLSAATVLLAYHLALALYGRRAAVAAGLMLAVYPNAVLYTSRAFTETLFSFVATALALCLVRAFQPEQQRVVRWAVLGGLCLGLALLTRGTLVLLPPFLLLGMGAFASLRSGRSLAAWGVVCMTAALTVAPWLVRNYRESGAVVYSTWSFAPAYHGQFVSEHLFSDDRTGFELDRQASRERIAYLGRNADVLDSAPNPIARERRADALARTLWLEGVTERPARTAALYVRDLVLVWFLTYQPTSTTVSGLIHLPLLVLLLVVLLRDRRLVHDPGSTVLLLLVGYLVLFHGLVYPHVRYLMPLVPLVMVLVASVLRATPRERGNAGEF